MSKEFHIGDILSITTEYLLSPVQMKGVYGILNFMTRDSLGTIQLVRVRDECKPYLAKQFPWSSNLDEYFEKAIKERPFVDNRDLMAWLEPLIAKHGEYHMVDEIPMDDHDIIDHVDEAIKLMGKNRVITVDVTPDELSPFGDIDWKPE